MRLTSCCAAWATTRTQTAPISLPFLRRTAYTEIPTNDAPKVLCRSCLSAGDAAVLERQLAPGHLMHELHSRDRFSCRFHSMPDAARSRVL